MQVRQDRVLSYLKRVNKRVKEMQCVCVCVRERERERKRERERDDI